VRNGGESRIVEMNDDSTLDDLVKVITATFNISSDSFGLKAGFPPQQLDLESRG
jgi:hypothetical protein